MIGEHNGCFYKAEAVKFTDFSFHDSLNIVHVRGKRGRQVPVTYDAEEQEALDTLVKYRGNVGISSDNIYVFAAPTRRSKRALRGSDCMRKIVDSVEELQYPERIKSAELRKYAATFSQIADSDENNFRWLADHLSHDLNVHREYYRLKNSTIELSQVSKLLLAMDEENAKNFAG